jgi:hypothetical protein
MPNGERLEQTPLPCDKCGAIGLKGSKMTPLSVLLRCPSCSAVQTIPERRRHPRPNRRTSKFPDINPSPGPADDAA